jgi:anti-sigma factor RsiW
MTCHEAEDNLAAYVDGLSSRAAEIDAHLATCAKCRDSVHAQRVGRTVLRQQASELLPLVPPGLRTRLIALGTQVPSPTSPNLAWTGRLTAFAAAAMVVLTLGAVLLPVVTIRSTAVLAAQLALDHLKCFTIDGDAGGESITKERAEAVLKQEYGLDVKVPASMPDEHLELLAVRRCLYGDGRAAHMLYRVAGEPVSLFIIPGMQRPATEMSLFGHDQLIWTEGDRTYMLVARGGLRGDLARVASHLRNEAK